MAALVVFPARKALAMTLSINIVQGEQMIMLGTQKLALMAPVFSMHDAQTFDARHVRDLRVVPVCVFATLLGHDGLIEDDWSELAQLVSIGFGWF